MRGKSLVGHCSSVGGKFTLRTMRTSVGWTLLMLLGCRLSCATLESTCTCPSSAVCLPDPESVLVPCPNVTAADVIFKLFKEQELISKVTCKGENNTLTCTLLHTRVGVVVEYKGLDFLLTGVTERSYGTYRCEGVCMYPPPMKEVNSPLLIVVKGHPCKSKKEPSNSPNCDDNSSQRLEWIWILTVALLSIYSGTVTVIAIVIWVRMRNEASQSDYMNTKPRGMRDGKKKRGIQKPIPRHF